MYAFESKIWHSILLLNTNSGLDWICQILFSIATQINANSFQSYTRIRYIWSVWNFFFLIWALCSVVLCSALVILEYVRFMEINLQIMLTLVQFLNFVQFVLNNFIYLKWNSLNILPNSSSPIAIYNSLHSFFFYYFILGQWKMIMNTVSSIHFFPFVLSNNNLSKNKAFFSLL